MTNDDLARLLIEDFGGSENLTEVINCMTRVRVRVKNHDLIKYENIKSREGVLGLVEGEQVQVIMGPGKSEKIAHAMAKLSNSTFREESQEESLQRRTQENKEAVKAKQKQSAFKSFTSNIASIFVPLIPAFVGAGLIGGIASVLQNMVTAGSLNQESVGALIQVLNIMKNGLYAYLNIFIGINAAKVFGANQGLGGVVGGMVYLTGMNPDMPINNIF